MVVMPSKVLPAAIAEVIPGMRWSLAQDPPSMYYEPLEHLEKKIRPQQSGNQFELFQDIPNKIDTMFVSSSSSNDEDDDDMQDRRHFGMISLSLLLLGHDYVDECHDLVLALSWPSALDITFQGKTEYPQASTAARAFSSYVHCMVHRKEAFHVGEFGMVGFANANFWSSQVQQSGGENQLPQDQLQKTIKDLAAEKKKQASSDDESRIIQEWCDLIVKKGQYFDHCAVHDLAKTVLKKKKDKNNSSDTLRDFAEQIIQSEMHILLSHSLKRAGFDMEKDTMLSKYL